MANGQKKKYQKGKYDGPSMEEKVKQLVTVLDEGVKNFSYSPEEFKALLEMKALMPNYSFRNLMVAKLQYPNATFIASFKRWNELGRTIKKGQKHLKIFKPNFKKVESKDEDGYVSEEVKLVGFLTVPVFAYEQTEGDPLPIDRINIKLEGDCPEARQIISLAEQIAAKDDCPVSYGDAEGANGFYVPSTHEIVVSDTLSVNHRCKTLVHELVHSKVHRNSNASTTEKEVVAEGSAFVVCSFWGLDTSDYSFRYVKSWSKKDEDSLLKYGSQICDIAGRVIREFKELLETESSLDCKTA